MAINKMFIHCQTEAEFNKQFSEGNISNNSICFIKDSNKIWTHNNFYNTSEIKTDGGGSMFLSDDGNYKSIEFDFIKFSSNRLLKFYCIEPVTIIINNEETIYEANSSVSITLKDTDEWSIVPSSDNSIFLLEAWPGVLDTFYSWLEGVNVFSGIIFDMNDLSMYEKWNQGHQGQYHVQFAQYVNCVFWSDNPYISDIAKRTNYTLYNSSQLPLCYSTIPENTFKAFYCAYGVTNDPNWASQAYKDSFALATHATQVFSYYGLHSIGVFDMDASYFNITLPKDCRGLMYGAGNILNAGIFDAINVTNFGAKSGSWRDAFGLCHMLKNLYIKNLKVNINVSWSPINQQSLNYILENSANTSTITITLSPYTYMRLTDSNKTLAEQKKHNFRIK